MRFGIPLRPRAPSASTAPNVAARAAWALLRNRRVLGYKFERQYRLGGIELEFYCPALRLALEIAEPDEEREPTFEMWRTDTIDGQRVRIARIAYNAVSPSTFEEIIREHVAQTAG